MKEWLLPALGAIFFWGIWGFLPKIYVDYITPTSAVIYQSLGGLIVAVLLFSLEPRVQIDPKGSLLAVVAGAASYLGLLCYVKAVSKGQISIISIITALYPIVVIVVAFLVFQESLTWKQGIGIGFGLAAIALFAS